MFNFRVLDTAEQLRVILFDGEQWDLMTDVRGLLPLDFFRVGSILHSIYYVGKDEASKQRFGQLILNEINNHPWEAVDEVQNVLRPTSGKPAKGFKLYAVEIDYRTWDPQHRGQVVDSRLLYTFLSPSQ